MVMNIFKFWVWFIVLNLVVCTIFPEPVSYWWAIEIVLGIISTIMICE